MDDDNNNVVINTENDEPDTEIPDIELLKKLPDLERKGL